MGVPASQCSAEDFHVCVNLSNNHRALNMGFLVRFWINVTVGWRRF